MTPTRLKAIRTALSFSQQQLADKLELSQQTIYRFESGKRPIPRYVKFACMYLAFKYLDKKDRIRIVKANKNA